MTLEFSQNDNAPVNLAEMRFHIPSSDLAGDVDPAEAFKGKSIRLVPLVLLSRSVFYCLRVFAGSSSNNKVAFQLF